MQRDTKKSRGRRIRYDALEKQMNEKKNQI